MVRRVRFLRVHFWSGHLQYWMGPRSTLRYSEVPQNTQRYLKVPKCTVATWVPIWGTRSPWGPYSVFGSPFLFQGPHCLNLMLKNAWKVHALPLSIVDNKITCDNTHESHANLSVTSVLFQNNVFPPFEGIISINYLVSINFANMRFLGPHSAGEGPHLVPISLKIGSPCKLGAVHLSQTPCKLVFTRWRMV